MKLPQPITTTAASLRRSLVPKLDPPTGETWWDEHRPLTRDRSPWNGPDEYVGTVTCSREELVSALVAAGYQPNVFSTYKYVYDDAVSWESGSFAYWPTRFGEFMHHCYFFEAEGDGHTFHLHHHKEWNYWNDIATLRPLREGVVNHFSGDRWHGDPDGVLSDALEESSVGVVELESPRYE